MPTSVRAPPPNKRDGGRRPHVGIATALLVGGTGTRTTTPLISISVRRMAKCDVCPRMEVRNAIRTIRHRERGPTDNYSHSIITTRTHTRSQDIFYACVLRIQLQSIDKHTHVYTCTMRSTQTRRCIIPTLCGAHRIAVALSPPPVRCILFLGTPYSLRQRKTHTCGTCMLCSCLHYTCVCVPCYLFAVVFHRRHTCTKCISFAYAFTCSRFVLTNDNTRLPSDLEQRDVLRSRKTALA